MDSTKTGRKLGFLSPKNETAQKWLGFITLGIVGFSVWSWLVPIILSTLFGTLQIIVLGTIIVTFVALIANPKFLWIAGLLLQRIIDTLASAVVKRDPIAIMKYYLTEVKQKVESLAASIGDVRGSVSKAKRDLSIAEQEKEGFDRQLLGYQSRGQQNSPSAVTVAKAANRRDIQIQRIKNDIVQGERAITILELYYEQAVAYRDDLADNIEFTASERKRVKTMAGAFGAIKSIMKHNSIGGEMFDEAVQTNSEQVTAMVGEMEQFISESQSVVRGFDMEQEGAVQQALARIEQKQQTSLMLEHKPLESTPVTEAAREKSPSIIAIDEFLK